MYFEKYRADMLEEVGNIGPPTRDAHKVLWWKQPWIVKGIKEIRGEKKRPGKAVISPRRQEIRKSKNLRNRY